MEVNEGIHGLAHNFRFVIWLRLCGWLNKQNDLRRAGRVVLWYGSGNILGFPSGLTSIIFSGLARITNDHFTTHRISRQCPGEGSGRVGAPALLALGYGSISFLSVLSIFGCFAFRFATSGLIRKSCPVVYIHWATESRKGRQE